MAISSPGLGSGLDVNGIVTQLMALERQPINDLDRKEATQQAKLSAYGSLKGAISSFQNAMSGLASASRFTAYSVSSSASSTVGASIGGTAVAGSYTLDITNLAQAQKLVATGQTSDTAQIGTGANTTLTFDFGTLSGGSFDADTGQYTGAAFTSGGSGAKTVTIGSSNNTLAGIRDAINAASIGVTASVINDGSGSPYRLVLSGNNTGADKSLKISVSGDATIASLLAHDPAGSQALSETVTAKNATFKVDGIAMSKTSNTITDAIAGVTLTLAKPPADSTPIKITVSQDKNQITGLVNSFAKAYNDLNKTLSDASAYNASTKQAAILNGDATVRSIQYQVRAMLSSPVTGTSGTFTTLSQIGVSFQKDGTLAVDSSKLQDAITKSADAVAALFAAAGSASDPLATYTSATPATKPGQYALGVTSLATQGSVSGSAAAALTITQGVNDTVAFNVDGVDATVTLAAGTYTAAQLALLVQSSLNGASALSTAGVNVTVTQNAGALTITSNRYGAASKVQVSGGNGAADLLGASPTTTPGADIAGSINGVTAIGNGQTLTGATGNDADGLKFKITGGATGSRGSVYYSTGYAYQLQALAGRFLDTDGAITSRTDGINKTIADIDKRREALQLRMDAIEKRYRAQFTALDTMMSSMSKTSTFLQQQLANLPKTSSN
jgi:flagellar hook-associated protein 2